MFKVINTKWCSKSYGIAWSGPPEYPRQADVHARYLALSKDEGTLYFSDNQAKAIRKILLDKLC